MAKGKINIKKLFIPTDLVPMLVVIVGIFIAIFLEELAIRLIGISVAILGGVALFMIISQRISETVNVRFNPSQPLPEYTITETKGEQARSLVIEDFNTKFDPNDEPPRKQEPEPKKDTGGGGEGFRVVRRVPKRTDQPSETKPLYTHRETRTQDQTTIVPQASKPEIKIPEEIALEYEKADIQDRPAENAIQKDEITLPEIAFEKDEFELLTDPNEIASILDQEKATVIALDETIETVDLSATVAAKEQPGQIDILETEEQEEVQEEKKIEDVQISETPKAEIPDEITGAEAAKVKETPKLDYIEKPLDIQLSVLMEETPLIGQEPRKEFEYFLTRVLMAIRSVTNTQTAAFILVNTEKMQLVLESFVTDVPDAIATNYKFPIGSDVVSQIVFHKKPEILTEINPSAELDLIPYYRKSAKVSSFIGVPVFFNDAVIGVLCADTSVQDAYDSFTVGFLGHFTKLISGLVMSYTDKYDLLQASRTLDAINIFNSITDNQELSLDDITASVVETASVIFEHSTIGLCGYDESAGGWIIKAQTEDQKGGQIPTTLLSLDNSIVGDVIMTGKTAIISPIEDDSIRVLPGEEENTGGFFAAIPIPLKTIGTNYGALYLEARNQTSLTQYDIGILETICRHAGNNIEKMHFVDMLRNSAMFDTSTGMLNPPAFHQRLGEEHSRSMDFDTPLTLCLFQVDKYASFDPQRFQERMEKALYHIIGTIKKMIRSYDIFGRADTSTFGIAIVGMKLEQSQIWAEKLRVEIARTVMDMESKKFSVTISMGLADTTNAASPDLLLANSRRALDLSLDKTNCVTIYS